MTIPATFNAEATPHFSYTRIQKYLTCPEQYRLHYVEKLRPKIESASLVFGSVMHLALAEYFRRSVDPVKTFLQDWDALKDVHLRFSKKESWARLRESGQGLLAKFMAEEAQKITQVFSVERVSTLGLSNLALPFVAIIDLVAEMDGKRTLVEFKTAISDFEHFEVALLDQLTAYKLAEPEVEQIAICVFLKTKAPKIRWHRTDRNPQQVTEYLEKAELVTQQIAQGIFYKRIGKWCRQCDFLSLCLGNKTQARALLTPSQNFVRKGATNARSE
jgi:putative RecB family exonuclease